VARERHRLGLDQPLPAQYLAYVEGALHGDLGESLRTRRPVVADLREFGPTTLELALAAMLMAGAAGLLLGVLGAVSARGAGPVRLLLVIGASAPPFLLALLLILVFYVQLSWLPASGRTDLQDAPGGPTGLLLLDALLAGRPDVLGNAITHLILPAVCLAFCPAAALGRVLRSSLREVLGTDHVRTARAKGVAPFHILWRHCLRNAASAPLTMFALQLGLLLGADVVVETVFAWPGIGLYTQQSIASGDFQAVAGVTLLLGLAYVLLNLLVDLGQAAADPRVRA
jgi:peptide/nickel transport system permease protein